MGDKIILTNHAKQRMIERKISLDEVKETIEFPDYKIIKAGKIEAHKKLNEKNLKIIYVLKDKFIKIITVIRK